MHLLLHSSGKVHLAMGSSAHYFFVLITNTGKIEAENALKKNK